MARGDHIMVPRLGGLFTHHGIDCGDGTVIHFTGETWSTPRSVQRTSMAQFSRGTAVERRDYEKFFEELGSPEHLPRRVQIRVENEWSRLVGREVTVGRFEPGAVVARAESQLGRRDFDTMFNNCEHFATWCKTGIRDSQQVYALWQSILDPMNYYRLRRDDLLTSLLDAKPRRRKRPT